VGQRTDLQSLSALVSTGEEFDRLTGDTLPDLLDHAAGQTRRYLRETGQWVEDIGHEKLALRWGYELVERFLACGRSEVPCRPLFLLDSLIAKFFTQPNPLCYHKDLCSPLGRFLDGLTSRAVLSRDALMALYYHLYGFGQGRVMQLLGLSAAESQRVYKNFERWRRAGWQRAVREIGISETELRELEKLQTRDPRGLNEEADRLIPMVQEHYRRSEPEHFPCLTRRQWGDLFDQGYGYDYRVWHLALCRNCMAQAYAMRLDGEEQTEGLQIDLHLRPLLKGKGASFLWVQRGGGNGTERPAQRISTASR